MNRSLPLNLSFAGSLLSNWAVGGIVTGDVGTAGVPVAIAGVIVQFLGFYAKRPGSSPLRRRRLLERKTAKIRGEYPLETPALILRVFGSQGKPEIPRNIGFIRS